MLPGNVSSPQDIAALIMEVREYSKWFSHETLKRKVQVSHSATAPILTPETSEYLRQMNAATPFTAQRLDSLIATLEDYKKNAPRLTITLAAPVTLPIKKQLTDWLRDNISPSVLVSFQFNSTLLGGMVVRCGSRVFDWSFKRKLLEKQHDIAEVISRV